jgi:hypothetical protein
MVMQKSHGFADWEQNLPPSCKSWICNRENYWLLRDFELNKKWEKFVDFFGLLVRFRLASNFEKCTNTTTNKTFLAKYQRGTASALGGYLYF